MVLLTMTPAMVTAIRRYSELQADNVADENQSSSEPPLDDPKVGNPISHGQVIDISRYLRDNDLASSPPDRPSSHLDVLLRGARVYIPRPKPAPEPTPEYKALMARLRREEEARNYERMLHSDSHLDLQQSSLGPKESTQEEDELVYADINRQLALILNFLVSIFACGVAVWIACRPWQVPLRLGASMAASVIVGVAEVVVYAGYLRRIKEAKEKSKKQVVTKEVVETWVIGPKDSKAQKRSERAREGRRSELGIRQRKAIQ